MEPEVKIGLLVISIGIINAVQNIRSGHKGIGLRSQIHSVYLYVYVVIFMGCDFIIRASPVIVR